MGSTRPSAIHFMERLFDLSQQELDKAISIDPGEENARRMLRRFIPREKSS